MPCPFCAIDPSTAIAANDLAFAVRDLYPVSSGHTLVIPRRHVEGWFDATRAEQVAILELIDELKRDLDAGEPAPSGYNIGTNVGRDAGQTVMHLHVHLIPRFFGDMDDPRGGVRRVIRGRGRYPTGG